MDLHLFTAHAEVGLVIHIPGIWLVLSDAQRDLNQDPCFSPPDPLLNESRGSGQGQPEAETGKSGPVVPQVVRRSSEIGFTADTIRLFNESTAPVQTTCISAGSTVVA